MDKCYDIYEIVKIIFVSHFNLTLIKITYLLY